MSEKISNGEKKTLAFSFSKSKPKVNLVKTEITKTFVADDTKKNEIELITGIAGKKLQSLNKTSEAIKKPLVIPCQKNELNFNIKPNDTNNKTSPEDLEIINALVADSMNVKLNNKVDAVLAIDSTQVVDEKKIIEEPNYEAIGIEQFGLAAIRGMGWSEKNGIGLTNKRTSEMVEVELRPKGLGLGAGGNKKKRSEIETSQNSENGLRYSKGSYIQITTGKHCNQYGQILSFDDGLDRIIVQLDSTDEKVSVLQACTKLLTKDEYKKATQRSKK